jgi:hypothetical protein
LDPYSSEAERDSQAIFDPDPAFGSTKMSATQTRTATIDPSSSPAAQSLIHDMLEWISREPRTYLEAMEAWRSSCPRLTIWEDALAADFIRVRSGSTRGESIVELTARGEALIASSRD